LSGLVIILSIIYSTFITYIFTFYFAMAISIIIFAVSIFLIKNGIFGLKCEKYKRDSNEIFEFSKKYYLILAIYQFLLMSILMFFISGYFIFDYIDVHDSIGYALSNITTALFFGSLILFGTTGYKAMRIYINKKNNRKAKDQHKLFQYKKKNAKNNNINSIRTDDFNVMRKFQAIGIVCILIISGLIGILTLIFSPDCYWGFMGFSEPAYDLPTGNHENSDLDNESLVNQEILESLEKGLWAITKLRQQGGFPMWVEEDGSHFYSDRGFDCPLFPGEFSLQEGTALLGSLFLEMYKIEPNEVYLDVAEDAAKALLAVQDEKNGGFYYDGRRYEDGTGYQPHPKNLRRSAILDDNVMQSCLSYLLDIYNTTKKEKYLKGFKKGFECLCNIEKPQGGWPQRSNYRDNVYYSYVTLNDHALKDVVFVLLKAYKLFPDEDEYLKAAKRACNFLIDVQGNGGSKEQKAWAQQYDDNNQPAWARDFEPPAMCSATTVDAMECLLEMYLATNNSKWLDPIPDAIEWLEDSDTIIEWEEDGKKKTGYARLYELKTNKPIFGINYGRGKLIPYVYDYNLARKGYSWVGDFGVSKFISRYELLISLNFNIKAFIEADNELPSLSSATEKALYYVEEQTDDGFWLHEGRIYSGACSEACLAIMDYIKVALS
ncbi:MAG: pectate lyase, partial [Promethearchaeota archaeon]